MMKSPISTVGIIDAEGRHYVPRVGFADGSRVAPGLEQLKVGRIC